MLNDCRHQFCSGRCEQEEHHDEQQDYSARHEVDVAAYGEFIQQRKQQDTQDIVDYGGAHDDLGFMAMLAIQVGKHTQSDAYAGGSNGAGNKHANDHVQFKPAET